LPSAYVWGGFTTDFGCTNLVGVGISDGRLSSLLGGIGTSQLSSSLGGIGTSQLSSSLGDAVSFALHDGVIFFLPPTL
jgi:hypothetical protein